MSERIEERMLGTNEERDECLYTLQRDNSTRHVKEAVLAEAAKEGSITKLPERNLVSESRHVNRLIDHGQQGKSPGVTLRADLAVSSNGSSKRQPRSSSSKAKRIA